MSTICQPDNAWPGGSSIPFPGSGVWKAALRTGNTIGPGQVRSLAGISLLNGFRQVCQNITSDVLNLAF